MHLSPLQRYRLNYQPKLPKILEDLNILKIEELKYPVEQKDELLKKQFPKTSQQPFISFSKNKTSNVYSPVKVGVVFSGGQAPGGHNVIAGLYDALKKMNPQSTLIGFLNGPAGIINNKSIQITDELLKGYRNQGGFDLLKSGRTKIETEAQFQSSRETVEQLKLDALVIIGGDDSNTNAAFLAEYFLQKGTKTRVIGVPKTIDGDLKNEFIDISFGFDTACKVYSETIGNVLKDAQSSKKYYFFIKLMGRSASHITLECAIKTHPNMVLISEEILKKKQSLTDVVKQIADMICLRNEQGKDYGVILIPEGLIEFIPESQEMIAKLGGQHDAHGNVEVSKIETERLLISLVNSELDERKLKGSYKGNFSPQPIFCGYEGRSGLPSNFDCQYCYALGYVSALLIQAGVTGYMSCIRHLDQPVEKWELLGIPIYEMLHLEKRKDQLKPVIKKTLVDLSSDLFMSFQKERAKWMLSDDYICPGPIQFDGPEDIVDSLPYVIRKGTRDLRD